MEDILEILKYILPSLVVFGASYYVMKLFIENEGRKRQLNFKIENAKLITPLRLQAYERIVLFLERITPSNLIMRLLKKEMSAFDFQTFLIQNIRDEFEHNLSQQIYISEQSWELAKNAKEEIIRIINTAATTVPDNATATQISQAIIQKTIDIKEMPTHKAISLIKKEIGKSF